MKIKKINEVASDMNNEQLRDFRDRKFPNETVLQYELWGEDLKFSFPYYNMLYSSDSINDCINYYNNEITNSFSRIHKYENVLLIKKTKIIEQLDFDVYIKSKKYNI